ncbi:hypothetical protein TRICI_005490 [Trichomonascus ciferrii]|uniref:RRM domain-containing protein n=1 Tax=Trichomonascus ciferrii TaxID=44093 RepID=A0A642USH2_9ASCO|nr:hypothetical protein TRICI_005490 [Trichomonascus ciferrii]
MGKEEKRKRKEADAVDEEGEEELEIKLDEPQPLSKKQKRLLKKGKTEISDSKKKKLKKSQKDDADLYEEEEVEVATAEPSKESKRSDYCAWIGNLSFETTKDEIKRFLVAKSDAITEDSITRINLPKGNRPGQCKGFAYVDFKTQEQLDACIGLSESNLSGRNLLIKNGKSFEGRPDKSQTNPPSRILFVGNLSFDTTEENLEYHFQHCGEIVKIRMATFEDSGKCKGFAFIDFLHTDSATKALKDKRCKKLFGRPLRMEYGEDRSKRTRNEKRPTNTENQSDEPQGRPQRTSDHAIAEEVLSNTSDAPPKRQRPHKPKPDYSNKPGLALANAQRGRVGIVQSQGKKVTFD